MSMQPFETPLSIHAIDKFDSDFNRDVNRAIEELTKDCLERPRIKGKRTLVLTLQFSPDKEIANKINVATKVGRKTPDRTYEPVAGRVNVIEGTIKFRHHQNELFSDYDEAEEPEETKPDHKAKAAGE